MADSSRSRWPATCSFPNDSWATVATGFLAAGPWDESSLRDIREDSIDREIGRYLDRDDMVTTVMATFVSSTVHCARCHDHKFDPITQEDYYALQAVFAGTDKANRPYDPDSRVAARRQEVARRNALLLLTVPVVAAGRASGIAVLRTELATLPPQQVVYCGTHTFIPDGKFRPGLARGRFTCSSAATCGRPGRWPFREP